MSLLFLPADQRRLIPARGLRGATPWIIAIMVFVMLIVAAAALSLANFSATMKQQTSQRFSVQLADGNTRLGQATAVARSTPGIAAIRPVPEAEMQATLERWLGPAGRDAGLPLPAIIDLDLAPAADPATVGRRIETALPGARFVAHADSLAPLLRALRTLTVLAGSLVLLVAVANSAAVVLATRGALDTNRPTIEVLHGVGATDQQVARLFQRRIAIDAAIGGAAGGVAAALALAALIVTGRGWLTELVGMAVLRGRDIVLLALLPLVVAALATLVARIAVLAALRERL